MDPIYQGYELSAYLDGWIVMVATPSRWKPFIGLGVALAAAAPATSAMAVGPQAALGWRIVYRHVTTNSFSSYRAVATSGLSPAWPVTAPP